MCPLEKKLKILFQFEKGTGGRYSFGIKHIPAIVAKAVKVFSHQFTEPSFNLIPYNRIPDFPGYSKTEPFIRAAGEPVNDNGFTVFLISPLINTKKLRPFFQTILSGNTQWSGSKFFSTLTASGTDHSFSTLGFHTHKKTMGFMSFSSVGFKCRFHIPLLSTWSSVRTNHM